MFRLSLITAFALYALVQSAPLEPTEYIVQLKTDASLETFANRLNNLSGEFSIMSFTETIAQQFKIGNAFQAAYTTKLSPQQVEQINALPEVASIVPNLEFSVFNDIPSQKEQFIDDSNMWGLDRVNAKKGLDQKYTWTVDGSNVDCYVVDTGIMASHHEFEGRIIQGASFIQNEDTDLHGHGSHVAAIMAGASYGVAKNCSIFPVKIFNRLGRGSFTTIIAGLSWVAESVKQRKKPSVVNMSLGGPKTQTLNDAVKALVDLGIVVVVAGGNSNSDACEFSPASEPSVITVGATNKSDIRAKFSNYGQCLDVFAPGEDIKSAGVSDANASAIMSGTSMATPFVAGVAALYLSANQSGTAASFAEVLKKTATADAIEPSSIMANSPNLLVYSLLDFNSSEPIKEQHD